MTLSSCKRDTKSKSHPGVKLVPVRVFSCKHPQRKEVSAVFCVVVQLRQLRNSVYFLHDCERGDYMLLCNALVLCQVLSSTCALLFQCSSMLLNVRYHNIVSIPLLRIPMSRKQIRWKKEEGGGGWGLKFLFLCINFEGNILTFLCTFSLFFSRMLFT